MIEKLTTPLDRFENLPGYPFKPNYIEVGDGLSMHYVEEGPKDGPLVLCLHGEPSWSYLYRTMIPVFAEAGCRVIAPDLIGFGKSDKPIHQSDYTYQGHVNWMVRFIEQLDLTNINLFCQDWGGLIGLQIAGFHAAKFNSIIAANTFLNNGNGTMPEAFLKWRKFSQEVPEFPVGPVINNATTSTMDDATIAAYDAPFPDESYKAGARIFPALVPIEADEESAQINQKAWANLVQWNKPFLTLFSDTDPITKGLEKVFQKLIPGAKDQDHCIIENGGHFLQEDKGPEIAQKVVEFLKKNRLA